MSKKQKTAAEETQELVQKIQDDEIKKIDVSFEDLEEEPKTEEPSTEIEKKVEEKRVVPEDKEEQKVEKETEIDEDQLTDKISKRVADTLVKQLTGTADKPADSEDQELVSPWKKEGRNPVDYDEITEWAVKKIEILSERRQEAERKAKEEQEALTAQQQEELKKYQEEQNKAFNQVIDDELDELYTNNKLPRIKDKDDPKDIGVIARRALFQTMLDVNEKRRAEGKQPIMSVSRIFHTYYKQPSLQPAGADAPISMGQGSAEATDPDEYSYTDLKKDQRKWGFFRLR